MYLIRKVKAHGCFTVYLAQWWFTFQARKGLGFEVWGLRFGVWGLGFGGVEARREGCDKDMSFPVHDHT